MKALLTLAAMVAASVAVSGLIVIVFSAATLVAKLGAATVLFIVLAIAVHEAVDPD